MNTGLNRWLAIGAVAVGGIIAVLAVAIFFRDDDTISLDGIIADIDAGNFEDALRDLDRAEETFEVAGLTQSVAWTFGERGFIYLQQGLYGDGIEALDRAIDLDPMQPSFYNNRALNFQRAGRLDDAEADFSMALQLDPQNFNRYVERGFFYLNSGNPDLALLDGHSATNLAPNEPIAYTLRSDANIALGKFDQALLDVDKVVELTPGEWAPLLTRAITRNSAGDVPGAMVDLDAALALDPPPEGKRLIEDTRNVISQGTGG
jgi:tetratricopeptide (TPR) repeat protein